MENQTMDLERTDINWLTEQVLSSNESLSVLSETMNLSLSDWQLSQLENVQESESGVRCLLNSWLVTQKGLQQGSYCNATWDNVYCWPPTSLGMTVSRTCIDAFKETEPLYAQHLQGHGYRVCTQNGSWLWDNWTNYTECADSLDAYVDRTVKHVEESEVVTTVQYILFIGSILSLLFILSAVMIYFCFRSLWCDRVTIHIHLMTALMLRYITLLIITEPHIFNRSTSYRSHDGVCKGLLIVYLYATLCSINWMFIQGIYINGKLTTNVFNAQAPFKIYYTIGWLLPLVLMTIWSTIMNFNHAVHCWSGYAAMNEIWIIICPMVLALIINLIFLINILRVMLTKVGTPRSNTDARQFMRAAKATILLFPLLGINNLLVLYNPGGDIYKYFVIVNTLFSSAQGIFVAVGYCFLNNDVRAAFKRVYRRFRARRNANGIRSRGSSQSRGNANSIRCHEYPQNRGNSSRINRSAFVAEQPVNSHNNCRPKNPESLLVYLNNSNNNSANNNQTSIRANIQPFNLSGKAPCQNRQHAHNPLNLAGSSIYTNPNANTFRKSTLDGNNSMLVPKVHSSFVNNAGASTFRSLMDSGSSGESTAAATNAVKTFSKTTYV